LETNQKNKRIRINIENENMDGKQNSNFNLKKIGQGLSVLLAFLIILSVVVFWIYKYFPGQVGFLLEKIDLPRLAWQQQEPAATKEQKPAEYVSNNSYEQAIIDAVKKANDSVVSIIVSKDLPVYEQQWVNPFGEDSPFNIQVPEYVQKGTKYQEIGSGSGFIVSSDGLILTNKHVVSDKTADYSVVTNGGKTYSAKVLATDPVQDLAIIKIDNSDGEAFLPLQLADSDGIQLGQTVIAIGNALGEFSNTVSVGIVSGLSRTISASDNSRQILETLEDIIQTDAAINSGNSGGPLMNLKGEVIGINTAIAENAENIAFAIPINYAKRDIQQVVETNKISYPFLGIRYILVDSSAKEKYELTVDYGAYVSGLGKGEPAIIPDSPAQKSGLKEGDIILELNGEKITAQNSLAKIVQKYNVGDTVALKVLRDGSEFEVSITLAERQN